MTAVVGLLSFVHLKVSYQDQQLESFLKNMIKFRNDLQPADWTPVYNGVDINHLYDTFLNTNAFERCFTLTKLSRKRMKDKPWVTTALKKSSNFKNLL